MRINPSIPPGIIIGYRISALSIIGGIVAVVMHRSGVTEFSFLGVRLTSAHVGVAVIGIGLLMAYLIVRPVLENMQSMAARPRNRYLTSAYTQRQAALEMQMQALKEQFIALRAALDAQKPQQQVLDSAMPPIEPAPPSAPTYL